MFECTGWVFEEPKYGDDTTRQYPVVYSNERDSNHVVN